MTKKQSDATAPSSESDDAPRPVNEYVRILVTLLASLGKGPTNEERVFYASGIADVDAHAAGTRVDSGALLSEWCRVSGLLADRVRAVNIPGYGPLRFHYGCGLALQLARSLDAHNRLVVSAAGASSTSTTSLMTTRKARQAALRALKTLMAGDAAAMARIRAAAQGSDRPDERSRALDALARELENVMHSLPSRVVAEAGVTRELVETLRAAARSFVAAKSAQSSERGAVAASFNVLNTLDGRVLHELRVLVAAARAARSDDRHIPAVSSPMIGSRRKKKPATAPAPTPRPSDSPPVS